MEPVGLAVGVFGLAGLFTSCLDTIERIDSYRDFGDDSRSIAARFNADRLRLEQWGLAVGIKQGKLSDKHHHALDDQRTYALVVELMTIIQQISGDAEAMGDQYMPRADPRLAGNKSSLSNLPRPPRNMPVESKRQRIAWALGGKQKRIAQVEQFGILVQKLYELAPPDGTKARQLEHLDGTIHPEFCMGDLRRVLVRIEKEIEAETRRDLCAWIGGDTPNDLYDDSIEKRLAGTCDWILNRPVFQTWLMPDPSGEAAKLLWVHGPAGFGKTVTCARVVQYLSSTLQTPVVHFFLSSNFASRDDPYSAIRSWIVQLMLRDESAFDLIYERRLAQYEKVATRVTILTLFREIVQVVPNCTLVLDGLDECTWIGQHLANNSVTGFLQAIERAIMNTTSRVMIVSRNEPEIRDTFENDFKVGFIEYRITIDDVLGDVSSYSRAVIDQKLPNKNEVTKDEISQRLTDRCDGQFLWVKMQVDYLRRGMSKMQLQQAISDTPAGLVHIYERNWRSIEIYPPKDKERAISLLRWAAFSLRPLTIGEITEAVLIQDGYSDIPLAELPDSIDTDYVNTEIVHHCGSLIDVRKIDGEERTDLMTVHVTHFSVKQFLLLKMAFQENSLETNVGFHASYEAHQNALLAKRCIQYLSFSKTWDNIEQEFTCNLGATLRNYAAGLWYHHADLGEDNDNGMVKAINNFFDIPDGNFDQWRRWFDQNEYKYAAQAVFTKENSPNPLYYASRLGLNYTVEYLLRKQDREVDGEGPRGTPLSISCIRGHTEIVRSLLDAGASLTICDHMGRTPLFKSATLGTSEVLRLLLGKEASIDAQDNYGWTPLNIASYHGHLEVVRLLLAKGADLTIANNAGWAPLITVSQEGHLEVLRLLLEKGADLTLANNAGWTSVNIASSHGHLELVRLLLAKGADLTITDNAGWTPLNIASSHGHLEVVRLFFFFFF